MKWITRKNIKVDREPMLSGAGGPSPALHTDGGSHRTIDPHALIIPGPQGRNLH